MNKDKSTILIYHDWAPIVEELSEQEVGQLFKAIYKEWDGKCYGMQSNLKPILKFVISKIETNEEAYEEVKAKRLENLRKANERKRNANAVQMQSNSNANAVQLASVTVTDTDNVTDTVYPNGYIKENTKEKATKSRVFVPPTLEEVEAEIQAKGHHVDALEFFNYYDSQAWKKANGQRVSNWKGCLVTWDRKNRQNEKEQTQNSVTDWDKIAKEVEQLGYFDNGNNHANVFAGIPATVREDVGG